MIFVPGFAEALGTVAMVYQIILWLEKQDKNTVTEQKWKVVSGKSVLFGIGASSLLVCGVSAADAPQTNYYLRILLLGIVSGGLLAAWIMDVETHLIYDFVWWISGTAAVLLLILSGNAWILRWDLTSFIVLQHLLFGRLYGRADCHAICVCALVEGAFAMRMQDYLIHMLMALGILTVVQWYWGNVTADGRLKEAVPFLPYITVSFWGMLFLK